MREKIVQKISTYDPNAGIVLVGSRCLAHVANPQDWDVVAVSAHQQLGELLKQRDSEYVMTSDDSLRFDIEGTEVGIVPLHTTEFRRRIDVVLKGEDLSLIYKPWAIGLVAPEGFLGEISQGEVIRDMPDNLIAFYRQQLFPYSDALKQQIVEACTQDISGRIEQIKKALSRKDMISVTCVKSTIIFLILRLLVALEGKYFSGTKHNTEWPFLKNLNAKRELDILVRAEVDSSWVRDIERLLLTLSL